LPQGPLARDLVTVLQIVNDMEDRILIFDLDYRPVGKDQRRAVREGDAGRDLLRRSRAAGCRQLERLCDPSAGRRGPA